MLHFTVASAHSPGSQPRGTDTATDFHCISHGYLLFTAMNIISAMPHYGTGDSCSRRHLGTYMSHYTPITSNVHLEHTFTKKKWRCCILIQGSSFLTIQGRGSEIKFQRSATMPFKNTPLTFVLVSQSLTSNLYHWPC